MAVHWNDAALGDFYVWYAGYDHEGPQEPSGKRDPGYFPAAGDSIEVRVGYRHHTFQWKDGLLTGIKNGSDAFLPPTADGVLETYFRDFRPVVTRIVELCEDEGKYHGKPLPVGLVPAIRKGIDVGEYEHDLHCNFEYASARRDAKFALPAERTVR